MIVVDKDVQLADEQRSVAAEPLAGDWLIKVEGFEMPVEQRLHLGSPPAVQERRAELVQHCVIDGPGSVGQRGGFGIEVRSEIRPVVQLRAAGRNKRGCVTRVGIRREFKQAGSLAVGVGANRSEDVDGAADQIVLDTG